MSAARKDRRRADPGSTPQTWSTPRAFVEALAMRHTSGGFDIDVAATAANRVVEWHLGPGSARATDALAVPWNIDLEHRAVAAFCNPPWATVEPFVVHAIAEVEAGHCSVVVLVLPTRADARWWRLLERPPMGVVAHRDDVEGRIAYVDPLAMGRSGPAEGTTVWVLRPMLRAADYRTPRPRVVRGSPETK